MRHYSKVEWQSYINNDFDTLLQEQMQEHLLTCDNCMELYSELMDEINIEDMIVPENFTDRIMELVHKENIDCSQRKFKQSRINTIIYYASAASITLFLMSAGVFQDIYENFSFDTKHPPERSQKQSLFISGWTNRLTEETSKFIGLKGQ